jgi:hypothetical protein
MKSEGIERTMDEDKRWGQPAADKQEPCMHASDPLGRGPPVTWSSVIRGSYWPRPGCQTLAPRGVNAVKPSCNANYGENCMVITTGRHFINTQLVVTMLNYQKPLYTMSRAVLSLPLMQVEIYIPYRDICGCFLFGFSVPVFHVWLPDWPVAYAEYTVTRIIPLVVHRPHLHSAQGIRMQLGFTNKEPLIGHARVAHVYNYYVIMLTLNVTCRSLVLFYTCNYAAYDIGITRYFLLCNVNHSISKTHG